MSWNRAAENVAPSELTGHVGAFLRVHHQRVEHLKVRLLHLDDVVDGAHLTGYDGLWGKPQSNHCILTHHRRHDTMMLMVRMAKGGGCQLHGRPFALLILMWTACNICMIFKYSIGYFHSNWKKKVWFIFFQKYFNLFNKLLNVLNQNIFRVFFYKEVKPIPKEDQCPNLTHLVVTVVRNLTLNVIMITIKRNAATFMRGRRNIFLMCLCVSFFFG